MRVTLMDGNFSQENIKYVYNKKIKQSTRKKQKNVQITACLMSKTGEKIKNCFYNTPDKRSAPLSEFKSFVYIHENRPVYKDSFYINVPEKKMLSSYLFISYDHISLSNSEKSCTFGFSFLPMGYNNKIISSCSRELSVFCASNILDGNIDFIKSDKYIKRKEYQIISCNYNSEKYNRNMHLSDLLHWKDNISKKELLLDNVFKVNSASFSKSIKQTYDCLFAMLEHDFAMRIKEKIVKAIIHTTWEITNDGNEDTPEIQNIQFYIQNQIENTKIHSTFVSIYEKLTTDNLEDNYIKKSFECIDYLFWIVAVLEINDGSKEFSSLLKYLNLVLGIIQNSRDLDCKITILSRFSNTMRVLQKFLSCKKLIIVYFSLFACIEKNEDKSEIRFSKFKLLFELVSIQQENNRRLQKDLCVRVIQHLKRSDISSFPRDQREEIYVIAILKKMLYGLKRVENLEEIEGTEIAIELLKIFPDLIFFISKYQKNKRFSGKSGFSDLKKSVDIEDTLEDSNICLWHIFMFSFHFKVNLWEVLSVFCDQKKLMAEEMIKIFIRTCKNNIIDETWLVFKLVQQNVFSLFLITSKSIIEEFIYPKFEKSFIKNVLELYMLLIKNPSIMQNESTEKNNYVERNLKTRNSEIFVSFTDNLRMLKENVLFYQEYLLGKFFEMKDQDRSYEKSCSEIIYIFLKAEYEYQRKTTRTESETINSLHHYTQKADSDEIIQSILDRIEINLSREDDQMFIEAVKEFIKTIKKIKSYLSRISHAIENKSNVDEYAETDIFFKLLNILEKKKGIDEKVYYTYFKKFVTLQSTFQNWVEAGICQCKYIEMVDWSKIEKDELKTIENGQKKHQLYRKCIDYFMKGKDWERCIEVCGSLEEYYKRKKYNYAKVGKILEEKAKYFSIIGNSQKRFYPNYYRVRFIGNFDDDHKSSDWIYRSKELEQLTQFRSRLLKSYPNTAVSCKTELTEEEEKSEKCINITTLSVKSKCPKEDKTIKKDLKNFKDVQDYRSNNDIDEFYFSVPVQKGEKHSFKTLWTKRFCFKTEIKFPSIQRKARIIEKSEEMISPITSAIETIVTKTEELHEAIKKVKDSSEITTSLKTLAISLQGMIDAAVSGGTKVYIEEFFFSEPSYIQLYPGEKNGIEMFANKMKKQQQYLEEGLYMIRENITGYEKLLTHLTERFVQLKNYNEKLFDLVNKYTLSSSFYAFSKNG